MMMAPSAPAQGQWGQDETKELIRIRTELERDSTVAKRSKALWDAVSSNMSQRGFFRTPDQCKCKWKNLLNRYKVYFFFFFSISFFSFFRTRDAFAGRNKKYIHGLHFYGFSDQSSLTFRTFLPFFPLKNLLLFCFANVYHNWIPVLYVNSILVSGFICLLLLGVLGMKIMWCIRYWSSHLLRIAKE